MQFKPVHFPISTLKKYIFGIYGRKNIQSLLYGCHREAINLYMNSMTLTVKTYGLADFSFTTWQQVEVDSIYLSVMGTNMFIIGKLILHTGPLAICAYENDSRFMQSFDKSVATLAY